MIKHIVMWRFAEQAAGNSREQNIAEAAARLQALPQRVPQIREFRVHRGLPLGDRSFELVLDSTFDSVEDLRAYQDHPAHQEVVAFLRAVQSERATVDAEIS
jgi:hypothetical protein